MKYLLKIIAFTVLLPYVAFAQMEIKACFDLVNAADYDRAIETGRKAVRQYPKNSDAHYCLGNAYRLKGELKKALTEMKEAEKYSTAEKDLAPIYNEVGMITEKLGDYDNSLLYQSKALRLSKNLQDKKGEATALSNIAVVYYKKSDFEKAMAYYNESLKLTSDGN